VLATSREPLGLAREECYPVAPLALPPDGADLDVVDRSPAVALFVERALARDPAFAMTPATTTLVAEVCRRVDGLPLAIELGAARCSVLSPAEIAQRLDAALAVLGRGPRDAPARQRTLRATIDWSFELLDHAERSAFTAFAVFAGGATVEAAEAITGASLDTLDQLVAKSLVVREHAHAATRLRMLETIRAYASERLASLADKEAVCQRHYRYYLAHAQRHGSERALWGVSGRDHLAALDVDVPNLHAALAWAIDRDSAEPALLLCAALGPFWLLRDRYDEALEWIDQVLSAPGADAHPALCVRILCHKAWCLWPLGRGPERPAVLDEAEAIARRLADPVLLSQVLQTRAAHAGAAGSLHVAARLADNALHAASAAGDEWLFAIAAMSRALASANTAELRERVEWAAALLERVGNVYLLADLLASAAYAALRNGSNDDAREFVDRAIPIARELDNAYGWMILQGNLALAKLLTGDPEAAREAFCEELRLCRKLGVLPLASEGLLGLAAVSVVRNDLHRAARLVGAAAAHSYGARQDEIKARLDATFLDPARKRHGTGAWDTAVGDGTALSFEDAIAYALEEVGA
jgi:predicted ATPase